MTKRLTPTDPDTYARATFVLKGARARGLDPVEALNQEELLLTPRRRQQLELSVLAVLQDKFITYRAAEFLRLVNKGGQSGTAADMLRAVQLFVDMMIKELEDTK